MPYVKRDPDGKIVAVFAGPGEQGVQEVPEDDPELAAFFNTHQPGAAQKEWLESDLSLARVLEDLIDLLIERQYFMFTDLPKAAQEKLLQRRGLRKEFSYVESLFGDEEELSGHGDDDGFL